MAKGIFDGDPKYERLKELREGMGYKGWVNQDGKAVSKDGKEIFKKSTAPGAGKR